ncbi:MAG: universal stress protein [Bacteroidota bacterium]
MTKNVDDSGGPAWRVAPPESVEIIGGDERAEDDRTPTDRADFLTATFMRRVLVPTDFSETADRALTLAIRFAKLVRAAIDLVHVYPLPVYAPATDVPGAFPLPPTPEILADVEHGLARAAARVRDAGVECQVASMEGRASDEIVAHATKIGADLIVMGSHGRSGLRRALLGSVAEQVLHKVKCPVLVVPAAGAPDLGLSVSA